MTMRRHLAIAALVAACLAPLGSTPSHAAALVVCAPEPAVGVAGPRSVTNPNTTNRYTLGSNGCAVMRNDDAAFFFTRGFTQGPNTYQVFFSQQTTGFTWTLPLSGFIKNIIFSELTGNAVSSGICVGTGTYSNSDVATMTGAASTLKAVTDASMAKRPLSISVATPIYIDSCNDTGFGTSKYDVSIEYGYF